VCGEGFGWVVVCLGVPDDRMFCLLQFRVVCVFPPCLVLPRCFNDLDHLYLHVIEELCG
jgi:hypothetical protein